jgi:hypothetical protein
MVHRLWNLILNKFEILNYGNSNEICLCEKCKQLLLIIAIASHARRCYIASRWKAAATIVPATFAGFQGGGELLSKCGQHQLPVTACSDFHLIRISNYAKEWVNSYKNL